MDLQARFDYLCHKLLDVAGSKLAPKSLDRTIPTLAVIQTDLGNVFIKRTQYGLHVSKPDYSGFFTIYQRLPGCDTAAVWDEADAAWLIPMIEQRIPLDLLAEL